MKIPATPKPENPVMIDRILAYMQDGLIKQLGWLDHSFGRAQRLVTKKDQRDYYYPAVYIGRNEYLNVLPGQGLKNRTFFHIGDPQEVQFNRFSYNTIKAPFSLVCWYDLTSIYPNSKERNTEEIKAQILRVLTNMVMPDGSRLEITSIYEQAENIFKEYSLKEIDTQFLMQPYAGVRFDGTLIFREECR